jgi:ABC-type uncharacterized transport system fused permease/ATPase subunit
VKFSPQSALQEGIFFCSTVCRELNVFNEEWKRSYFNVLANLCCYCCIHFLKCVLFLFTSVQLHVQLCVHVSTVFLKFMLSHTLRNYSKVPKLFVTRNPEPCFLTQVDQKFMSLLVM